jgi:hypothetical protein
VVAETHTVLSAAQNFEGNIMKEAIDILVAKIESWFNTPEPLTSQLQDQVIEFLQHLQGGHWGTPTLYQLNAAGHLHAWLENPKNSMHLKEWIAEQKG